MTSIFEHVTAAVDFIRAQSTEEPTIGVILGSGLGSFAAELIETITIPFSSIPHFPQSTVIGHSGNLILGRIGGVSVVVMQGRVHAYEGYSTAEVTFPIRVLGMLGVRTLVVTNAAGGVNPGLGAGTLVGISDHINLTGYNAVAGVNEPRFATRPGTAERFFDMTFAYSRHLRALAQDAATRLGFSLPEGVYLAVLGPSFETPAEIRAFQTLGADLVGMSTIHEVVVARHMGIEVLGFSLVTNAAAGVTLEQIDHSDVLEVGRQVEKRFKDLLTTVIVGISQERVV